MITFVDRWFSCDFDIRRDQLERYVGTRGSLRDLKDLRILCIGTAILTVMTATAFLGYVGMFSSSSSFSKTQYLSSPGQSEMVQRIRQSEQQRLGVHLQTAGIRSIRKRQVSWNMPAIYAANSLLVTSSRFFRNLLIHPQIQQSLSPKTNPAAHRTRQNQDSISPVTRFVWEEQSAVE